MADWLGYVKYIMSCKSDGRYGALSYRGPLSAALELRFALLVEGA